MCLGELCVSSPFLQFPFDWQPRRSVFLPAPVGSRTFLGLETSQRGSLLNLG